MLELSHKDLVFPQVTHGSIKKFQGKLEKNELSENKNTT